MSSSEFAIDTNAAVAFMEGDAAATARVGAASTVFMPVVVLGELYFGAEKSTQIAANLARVEALRSGITLLDCDAQTAREFGRLNHLLRRKGTPIPENDMWIAACALQHRLPLVTRDNHFQHVDGLTVISW